MWDNRRQKRNKNGIALLPPKGVPFDLAPVKSIFRQCVGKVRHKDRESARDHAKAADLRVYCCPWCNSFHVGHSEETLVTSAHVPKASPRRNR